MVKVNLIEAQLGLQARQKLGRSSEYGQGLHGSFERGEYNEKYGIYNVRHIRKKYFEAGDKERGKQYTQRKRFYIPTNPQSVPQQTNRAKLAAAVTAWQSLTDEQKDVYNQRAEGKKMSGYNFYLREHMLSN